MTATVEYARLLTYCAHATDAAPPCEPGILARCDACRLFYAPCTRTPIDVAAVLEGRWICPDCEAGR